MPGTTIPATEAEGAAIDATVSEELLNAPEAPAGYSGGSLGADSEEEVELSAAVDYEAIAAASADSEVVETIATVDGSSVTAPDFIGP